MVNTWMPFFSTALHVFGLLVSSVRIRLQPPWKTLSYLYCSGMLWGGLGDVLGGVLGHVWRYFLGYVGGARASFIRFLEVSKRLLETCSKKRTNTY